MSSSLGPNLAHRFRHSHITFPLAVLFAGLWIAYIHKRDKVRKAEQDLHAQIRAQFNGDAITARDRDLIAKHLKKTVPKSDADPASSSWTQPKKPSVEVFILSRGDGEEVPENVLAEYRLHAVINGDTGQDLAKGFVHGDGVDGSVLRESIRDFGGCSSSGKEDALTALRGGQFLKCLEGAREGLKGMTLGEKRKVVLKRLQNESDSIVLRGWKTLVLKVELEDVTEL